jgi:DNA polymerase-2
MKGFIIYPSYRVKAGKSQILLFGRLENKESFVVIYDFTPYFSIKKKDKENAEKLIKELNYENLKAEDVKIEDSDFKNFDREEVCKVSLRMPKQVPDLRKIFQDNNIICYEADIRFAYRFLIDYNIQACIDIQGEHRKPSPEENFFVEKVYENPKVSPLTFWPHLNVLSVDIETDISGKKILSISLYSDKVKQVLFLGKELGMEHAASYLNEKELLEAFKKYILTVDPDVITGWNLIDFDFNLLRDKFKEHNIPFILGRTDKECSLRLTDSFFRDSSADFPGRAVVDAIHLMKVSFIKLEDYKLNTAAKSILGEGKLIESDDRSKEIQELYDTNPKKLAEYNLKDAELVWKILEKTKVLDLSIRRSMLTGMQIDRVNASIASFDSLYLRKLKELKVVAPSAFVTESDERIKGGFVMQSKPGMYKGIIVLDFKSLYPSIIRTFNIDPYSFVPHDKFIKLPKKEQARLIEAPNSAHFLNQEGVLPQIIQTLWENRDHAKKEKDELANQAIKILMNSFFGVLANPTCRFYSLEMANAITHFGQFLIKLTASKIQEKGYEVIYGDTDSLFVDTATDNMKKAEKIGIGLQDYINAFYKDFIRKKYHRDSFLDLEFDKAFKKFMMPKIRGAEIGAKKRYAGLIEENGKEEIVVVGLEVVRRDWTELAKKFQFGLLEHIFHDKPIDAYIKNFVDDLQNGKMDSLLIYRKAIRKDVADYTKTTPPHIKAARKLGRELPGLIEYIMTVNGPEPLEKTSSKIDYEHYVDKQLKPIADSLLSFQDKSFDDLIAKQKQTDLSSWG